nr:hypothetical protein CFP56_77797 [Quercus suber]
MLSAMEYMLARINPADNELSLQVLVYTLWEHLRGRNLLRAVPDWKMGYEGMTVAYFQDYTAIHIENEELMLRMLSDGLCLVATIQAFKDLVEYNHDDNSVYEVIARYQDFIQHAVTIIGFGTTPITKKNYG